jgi:hypothetical protein
MELGMFLGFTVWYFYGALGDFWALSTCWYLIFGFFLLLGIAMGAFCGPIAWQKIYVEGVRGKKYIVK